ncbi:MAG: DUF4465 domain-containing protein [Muribaculaceae bacterium]|nr:DUF4465 domain-containing protein [Muribaculaceae bacterium]
MKKTTVLCSALTLCVCSTVAAADLVPATFEDLGLAPESHWCGDVDDEDYMMGTFRSGSFEFNNLYWAEYNSWAFFAYANYTGNVYKSLEDQFLTAPGGGYNSDTYGVMFVSSWMGSTQITLPDYEAEGAEVSGMWITNSAWVADAIANGDGMSGPFEAGDTMTLTVTGYDADENATSIETLLADYTSSNQEEWYAVNSWHWLDLTPLGKVTRMEFGITSTKTNDYGVTTPTYLCIDDLGAEHIGTGVGQTMAEIAPTDFRVSVTGECATVSGRMAEFSVRAVSLDGCVGPEVNAVGGTAVVTLPGRGVTLLNITTPYGNVTLKAIR